MFDCLWKHTSWQSIFFWQRINTISLFPWPTYSHSKHCRIIIHSIPSPISLQSNRFYSIDDDRIRWLGRLRPAKPLPMLLLFWKSVPLLSSFPPSLFRENVIYLLKKKARSVLCFMFDWRELPDWAKTNDNKSVMFNRSKIVHMDNNDGMSLVFQTSLGLRGCGALLFAFIQEKNDTLIPLLKYTWFL